MKKINYLLISIILTFLLSNKSYSLDNNNELQLLKEEHIFFCKNLNSTSISNIGRNWKIEKKK